LSACYVQAMDNSKLADLVIERLNDIAKTDPAAITAMIKTRVSCNEAMANHPTAQVIGTDGGGMIGLLGVVNGIVGVIPDGAKRGWGYITAYMDDDGNFVRFERTDGPSQESSQQDG
jgi:hypothetical protein